jgi:23S rRNA pseudouridine2605 synthase
MTKKKIKDEAIQPEGPETKLETAPEAEAAVVAEAAAEAEAVAEIAVAIEPKAAAKKKVAAKKKAAPKKKAAAKTEIKAAEPEIAVEIRVEAESENRVVDAEEEADEETEVVAEDAADIANADTATADANESDEDGAESNEDDENGFIPAPRPPAKLERLQKILAAAGIASRRKAEEMIEQGRVQVNGKLVTELGTKADLGRDHIRVDGKLLQGAERLRYFVLNKPKGFVTTVKDPEGRPTVMQFFDKMKERLYPVGRLDYMSEGLLVVTNDGELANKLTKASSGVEKTYLVKVAGQPTEDELDVLRGGVVIERGKPGSGRVRTSPARIRQVRQGDNPWFEVVLIEGRNRELRKMFEEVGHFVEKIRRVGYGPLVLDQEPGNLRELEAVELEALRKVAEGKLRTPKAKDLRRRNLLDAQLPTMRPKPSSRSSKPLAAQPYPSKSFEETPANGPSAYLPKPAFDAARPSRPATGRPTGPVRTSGSYSKSTGRPGRPTSPFDKGSERPRREFGAGRPAAGRSFDRPSSARTSSPRTSSDRPFTARPGSSSAGRPAWKKDDRPARPTASFSAGASGEERPRSSASRPSYEGTGRTGAGRPFAAKPSWQKPEREARPAFKRPLAPRRDSSSEDDGFGPVRPPNLHIEEISAEQFSPSRSSAPRPYAGRPSTGRPPSGRPSSSRPPSSRPSAPRSYSDRPKPNFDRAPSSDRPASKPFRSEGGLARPFTTSSGKPRAGGARPNNKPSFGARSAGSGPRSGADSRPDSRPSFGTKRPYSRPAGEGGSFAPRSPRPASGSGARSSKPFAPRTEGVSDYRPTKAKPYSGSTSRAERKAGPDWKSKSGPGGKSKPGGFSKSGSKSGSRPGGFKSGGKPGGKSSFKSKPGGKKF